MSPHLKTITDQASRLGPLPAAGDDMSAASIAAVAADAQALIGLAVAVLDAGKPLDVCGALNLQAALQLASQRLDAIHDALQP